MGAVPLGWFIKGNQGVKNQQQRRSDRSQDIARQQQQQQQQEQQERTSRHTPMHLLI